MTSGLITSWQIDGETMEIVTDFIFLGSKITAVMKLKTVTAVTAVMKLKGTCFLDKTMTNPDS